MQTVNPQDVVPSISVENLINQRGAVIERIERAIALLGEAAVIAQAARITDPERHQHFASLLDTSRYGCALLIDDPMPPIRKRIDAAAWDTLMHDSGLLSLMDAKAREQWNKKIADCDTPALTVDNIRATFSALHDSRAEMFERGVIECFKRLSWDYKTNRPFAFGKRFIIRLCYNGGSFDARPMGELADLQRVFCILDGKPEEDHRASLRIRLYDTEREHRASFLLPTAGTHEDQYMDFRWFKNGNAHVTFKRADLVERMNRILAKHFPGALAHDPHAEGKA